MERKRAPKGKGHGVQRAAYWASNTTGMREMERRHKERMKALEERPHPEHLLEPAELLERIWGR